jgi:hypothetical protein
MRRVSIEDSLFSSSLTVATDNRLEALYGYMEFGRQTISGTKEVWWMMGTGEGRRLEG